MDFQSIAQLIGSIGFPIVACLLAFWYIKQTTESHKQEIDRLSEALQNNTLALQHLADKMEEK